MLYEQNLTTENLKYIKENLNILDNDYDKSKSIQGKINKKYIRNNNKKYHYYGENYIKETYINKDLGQKFS